VFFGKVICEAYKSKQFFNEKYKLNERIYLGPTTTDNDLAFLMANLA